MENLKYVIDDLKDYLSLRIDAFKLRTIDNLSSLASTIFSTLLAVLLLCFVLIFLAIAATWGIAELVGSQIAAVLIMALLFFVAAAIVYSCRRKLFINPMVRTFSKIFYEKQKDPDYE